MTTATRVLVVEDEMMVAMLVEDIMAILDVNLNGARSFPIAAVLVDRGIPFVFATGYGSTGVEAEYPGVPVVSKPFTSGRLDEAFARMRSAPQPY